MIGRIIRDYYQYDEMSKSRVLIYILRDRQGKKVEKRIIDKDQYRPYAFFAPENTGIVTELATQLDSDVQVERVDTKLYIPESTIEKDGAKIIMNNPKDISVLRGRLESKGIWLWEANIRYMERLAIDNGYKNIVRIENGLPEAVDEEKYKIPIRKMPWDIEVYDKGSGGTLPERDKILSIAAGEKYFSGDENRIISDFLKYYNEFDVAYSWSSYDENYFKDRCKVLRKFVPIEFLSIDLLERYRFRGGRELESNTLKNIALVEGLPVKIQRPGKVADLTSDELKEYNMRDTEIIKWIEDGLEKDGVVKGRRRYISLEQEMADLAGFNIQFASQETHLWEMIYLRELARTGKPKALPTAGMRVELLEEKVGGWVRKPPPGVRKWVISADYVGLYATLIMNLKTCPLGLGIMSDKVREYMKLRNDLRQQMKGERDDNKRQELNQRQTAMKLVCNSGLGVVGYNRHGAGSLFSTTEFNKVTKKGKLVNEKSGEYLKEKGCRIYYGDTDSIFFSPPIKKVRTWRKDGKIKKKVVEYGLEEAKNLNVLLEKDGVEIESKEVYKELLFFAKKGSTEGAKKNYAGRQVYADGKYLKKPKYYSRGLRKTSYTAATKKIMEEAIVFALKKDTVGLVKRISDAYTDVMTGKLDKDLVITRNVKANLDEYKVVTDHVRAARKLIEKTGALTDFKIKFIYTDARNVEPIIEGEPFPKMTDEGRKRMWERDVFSQLQRILDSVGMEYGEGTFDKEQNKLESYFG
jgi:DNA polymerase elongation subunit (family B)